MDYGILGPLAVWSEGQELPLGAPKQRAVLAVLLLRANEVVPAATLIDEVWGEHPPTTALKALRVYISQLRRVLGDGVLETRPNGYVLNLDDGALDVRRFDQLLDRGRSLLVDGRAGEASTTLREALALWRGPPLVDFRYDGFARDEMARLNDLRLVAVERRVEADLALGRHADVVPELDALVRANPLHENLTRQLILALYRSGRQTDALKVYQQARRTLVEQFGLDPSQELQRLEQAILIHDPSLDLVPGAERAGVRPRLEPSAVVAGAPAVEARAQRKVVTVLFADMAGSTKLGETIDPEAVSALLERYFERAQQAVLRHGGVVEKFIGDAVMAVFGLPAVHEDDALRGLRAAVEIREIFAELGVEGRVGVNSGEVIVESGERLATGDAVNVAARLEQVAPPGEILVGETTTLLARDALVAEPLEPLTVKGKRDPVPVWRLVSVSHEAVARRFDSPLVGRMEELRALEAAWERVRGSQGCELVTVIGAAGVGKSRLLAEFAVRIDAQIASGRCLSYGAGITYLPIAEMLTQLAPHLSALEPNIASPLGGLLRDGGAASTDELSYSFRKLVEQAALARPLMLVFDDLQWAEEALLDLVEHVAYVSAGAPILLVCTARPDLLDRRPGWGGVLRIEPLASDDAERLMQACLGRQRGRDPAVEQHVLATAGGNPLFIEELAAMLQRSGEDVTVPPTIQALLASRLDQLDSAAREVLEAAAVEGEVFHRSAVGALVPDEPRLTTRLTELVRKDLVRPERPEFIGEDGFRFRHLLVRDVAYEAIPKARRSGLHERYAAWLEQHGNDLEALVGYHLEQATRYRLELGTLDERGRAVSRRAGVLLGSGARRSLARGDVPAAVNLLDRATRLLPETDRLGIALLAELGAALRESGELSRAEEVLGDALARAERLSDHAGELAAKVELAMLYLLKDPAASETDRLVSYVEQIAPSNEADGDDRVLAQAWTVIGLASGLWRGRHAQGEQALNRALAHARRAGDRRQESVILGRLGFVTTWGPTPVPAAIARCTELLALASGDPLMEADVLRCLASLEARQGSFDEARKLAARAREGYEELGMSLFAQALRAASGDIEMLAGNYEIAEHELQAACGSLEAMGERAYLSTVIAFLAKALYGQGRLDDALATARAAETSAATDDLWSQVIARGPHAKVLARQGAPEEAESLAREAVEIVSQTDALELHGCALVDLADVLRTRGAADQADRYLAHGIALLERKGITVLAAAARALFSSAEASPTPAAAGRTASRGR